MEHTIENINRQKTAIHCETIEEAERIATLCVRSIIEQAKEDWRKYGKFTCFSIDDSLGKEPHFTFKDFYKLKGFEIIPSNEIKS